jgi:hypothetical protein
MLIKFQSENHGDFVMFSEIAEQLLKMMGMSGKLEGAVSAEEVPEALARLERAVAPYKGQEDADDSRDEEPTVGLATRAVPLIDMLRVAKENNGYVMWRPQ